MNKRIALVLVLVLVLFALPVYAQSPGAVVIRGATVAAPTISGGAGYIFDGDSHAWRQGCDREGKPGSVYGKTGVIEGFACDIARDYRLLATFGEGGETCQQVWDGRAATKATKAKAIILSCGHNDTRQGVYLSQTTYYIRYLTKYHKALGRKVIWMTPPPATNWGVAWINSMNARQKQVGAYIRSVADCVIDAEKYIRPTYHLTDGIHLNKQGGAVLAPLAKECLK